MWLDIISRCSDIIFYTYTKQLDEDIINTLNNNYNNLNIIKSIIDNKYLNFGDDDYIKGVEKYLNANKQAYYICKWDNKQSGYYYVDLEGDDIKQYSYLNQSMNLDFQFISFN